MLESEDSQNSRMRAFVPSRWSMESNEPSHSSSQQNPPSHHRFLFVNGTRARSSGAVHQPSRSIVGSHVQRTIRRKRLEETTLRLRHAKFGALGCSYLPENHERPNDTKEEFPTKRPVGNSGNCDTNPHDQISDVSYPNELDSEPTGQKPMANSIDNTSQAISVIRPQAHSITNSRTTLPPITDLVDFPTLEATTVAFEHYMHTFVPKAFPTHAQYQDHNQWLVKHLGENEELLLAIVTLGATCYVSKAGRRAISLVPKNLDHGALSARDAIGFMQIAIKQLQTAIMLPQARQSSAVLYSVACLTLAEVLADNGPAVQLHATALRHLLASSRISDDIPTHVLHAVIMTYYIACAISGERPISLPTPILQVAEPSLQLKPSVLHNSQFQVAKLGLAFFSLDMQTILGPELTNAFQSMRTFTLWKEQHYSDCPQVGPDEFNYFHSWCWNSLHLVLGLPYQEASLQGNDDRKGSLREPCRIALLVFWLSITELHNPGSMIYRTLALRLKSALQRCPSEPPAWTDSNMAVFWLLLLGASITDGQDEYHWFLTGIAEEMRRRDNSLSWEVIENVVARFLYMEKLFRAGFKDAWDRAVQLRKWHEGCYCGDDFCRRVYDR